MSDLTLVGDELRLDGETVAVLAPGLPASLRYELESRFCRPRRSTLGQSRSDLERGDYVELSDRNRETVRQLRAERRPAVAA